MDGIGTAIIMLCIFCVLLFWGGYEAFYYFFVDDAIRVSEPIIPEIELIIKNNIVDTVYVYRAP